MNLHQAANYFVRTPVDGWNGTAWVTNIGYCTLIGSDRFVSERPFGLRRRYMLVDPQNPPNPSYKVVRLGGSVVYMVGDTQQDIEGTPYSNITLLHAAPQAGTLTGLTKVTAASGVPMGITKASLGTYHCDFENITGVASKEFPNVKFGDCMIYLPKGTPINTGHEFQIGTTTYEIELVYDYMGFVYARGMAQRTP